MKLQINRVHWLLIKRIKKIKLLINIVKLTEKKRQLNWQKLIEILNIDLMIGYINYRIIWITWMFLTKFYQILLTLKNIMTNFSKFMVIRQNKKPKVRINNKNKGKKSKVLKKKKVKKKNSKIKKKINSNKVNKMISKKKLCRKKKKKKTVKIKKNWITHHLFLFLNN